MTFLENYLQRVEADKPGLALALKKSAEEFASLHIDSFDFNSHKSGLLYGHVQSGKTGQMLAIAAAAADRGFKFAGIVRLDISQPMLYTLSQKLGHFLGRSYGSWS